MLLTRILTALALIPLVVGAVLWLPPLGLALLLAVVTGLSAWEWAQFALTQRSARALYALGLALGVIVLPTGALWVAALGMVLWLGMLVWLGLYPRGLRAGIGQPLLRLSVGAAILWLFALAALALAEREQGRLLVLVTLVLVWAVDVGGYFAGKRFGRHRLAPLVSPNKSWEGFWGGMLLALIVATGACWILVLDEGRTLGFIVLALGVSAGSVVGDLVESMFKRQSGIKDSGSLLPGHGGLLDRLDSSYAAMPLMLAGLLLLQGL